jgi:hypothetical protein
MRPEGRGLTLDYNLGIFCSDRSAACFYSTRNLELSTQFYERTEHTASQTEEVMLSVKWWSSKGIPLYQAVREVLTIAIITLTPVWAGVCLSLLLRELPSFQVALHANTDRGDLYLLATAMLAPLALYISVRQNALPKPLTIYFPGGWFFILLLVLLFGSSVILFAVKRIADSPTSTLKIDQDLFFLLSYVVYALSVGLSLVVTSIRYVLDALKPEETFREDTEDFVAAWSRREQ